VGHEVRGVVAHSKGAPVTVETVHVPDPGPGEALVAVQACGVCHTDFHYRQGATCIPRALSGLVLPVRTRAEYRVQRGHLVQRRARRDRAVILRLRHDHRVDPGQAAADLPADTCVRTGHGDSTRIGAEAPHLDEWLARGR
jgi:hypothetical protein